MAQSITQHDSYRFQHICCLVSRDIKSKKIVKIKLNPEGSGASAYDEFVTYNGQDAAAPCGLGFGPGGLCFSDLHGETDENTGRPIGGIDCVKTEKRLASASKKGILLAQPETYEMVESNIYFPLSSVNRQCFRKSRENITSPVVGKGVFYTLVVDGPEQKNAAWSFLELEAEFGQIRDYLAFGYGEVDLLNERTG